MSVATLKPGESGIVTRITATGALRQRLLDMGILPETKVDVSAPAPADSRSGSAARERDSRSAAGRPPESSPGASPDRRSLPFFAGELDASNIDCEPE